MFIDITFLVFINPTWHQVKFIKKEDFKKKFINNFFFSKSFLIFIKEGWITWKTKTVLWIKNIGRL
jgi:hypothetical protein